MDVISRSIEFYLSHHFLFRMFCHFATLTIGPVGKMAGGMKTGKIAGGSQELIR
jgi:hypothetical protein